MAKQFGYTLMELLLVIAVSSLLIIVAIPNSRQIYQKNQVEVISNQIVSAINYAKNLALVKGKPLTLVPDNTWSNGMKLLADYATAKPKLLYQWQWHYPAIKVKWHGFRSNHYLTITPALMHAAAGGSFSIYAAGILQNKLILNRLGRIRYSKP